MTNIKEALRIARGYIADDVTRKPSEYDPRADLRAIDAALAQLDSADARSAPWRYEVQHGPDGEADYAWVYDEANNLICTAKTHHAKAIVDRLSTGLLPDASTEPAFPAWGAEDEAYRLGRRDGYESAIQDLDIATGGDGEFKGSTTLGGTVDVSAMKARIVARADASPGNGAEKVREALARIPPDLFWLIGKGRLSPNEPMYAAQIKIGLDTISEAEHDDLATAINLACDRVALHSTSAAGETTKSDGINPVRGAESVSGAHVADRTGGANPPTGANSDGYDVRFHENVLGQLGATTKSDGGGGRARDFSTVAIDENFYFTWPKDGASEVQVQDSGGCMADFSSGDPNNLKELMAGPSVFDPPSEAADVLAMKEACKQAVYEADYLKDALANASPPDWKQDQAETTRIKPPATAEGGRDEPVAIKPLEWDKHPDEDEWFSHDHGLYDVSEYLVYKSPVSTTAWCLKVRGILLDEDFLGPDAAKAAARDDYEQRIRSALYTHPASPPDVEAIRADERERCARIADDHTPRKHEATLAAHVTGARIASAIRTGGQK